MPNNRFHILLLLAAARLCAMQLEFDFFDSSGTGDVLPSIILKVADEAYGYNMQGLNALDAGKFDEALEYFNQALSLVPQYSDAENNCGVVYFRRGNVARASDIWRALAAKDDEYATAFYNLGIVAFHEAKFAVALGLFEQAAKRNRRFVQAYVMTGRAKLSLGRKRDALDDLKKAYTLNPGEQAAWGMYAFALISTGDTAAAQKVLLKEKANSHALEMLGKLEASRGNLAKARQYLTESAACGGDPNVLFELALVLSDSGTCTEVLAALDSYMDRVSRPSADAFLLAGVAAKECGDVNGSRGFFEKGLAAYPDDGIMRFNLGQIYFYEKNFAAAKQTWAALADTLQDPTLYHLQALVAHREGDLAAAERYIRKAIALDRKADYCDFLGVLCHEKRQDTEAVKWFKEALTLNPALQSAQLNLALSLKSREELGPAVAAKRRELDACRSACDEILLQLAVLYYHMGDLAKASSTLEQIAPADRTERVSRHLAFFYRSRHAWDKAIDVLESARENLVVDAQTEYELVECYMQAGLYPQAAALLKNLVEKRHEDSWRLYYQLGYACMEQNKLAQAQEYLKRSMTLKAGYAPAQGLLAFVYNRQGRAGEARQLWEKTLEADPSNDVLWVNMGLALESEGRYAEALEKYRAAARLKPGDNAVQVNIGNACVSLGSFGEALAAYKLALTSHKRESAAYNAFVTAQKMSDRGEAGAMLAILEKEYPSSANTLRARAEMLLWDGDTAKALTIFEGLREHNENDWYVMARVYIARGQTGEAESALGHLPDDGEWKKAVRGLRAEQAFGQKRYEKALELWAQLADTSFAVRYNMALASLHGKNFDRALEIAAGIVEGAQGNNLADALRVAGSAAFGLKRWKEAKDWYSRLLPLRGNDAAVYQNLAVCDYNLGDPDMARTHYRRALQIEPALRDLKFESLLAAGEAPAEDVAEELDSLDRWYNEAVDLQTQTNDSAAETLYLRIVEHDARYYQAWNNLGAIYSARGDLRNAEKCYKHAIDRRQSLAEAYANLVNIYIAQQDFRQAKRWLSKGLENNPQNELLLETQQALDQAMEAR